MVGSDLEARAAAFRLLLRVGRPVTAQEIAAEIDAEPVVVEADLEGLNGAGRIRRSTEGQVVGSAGLSVAPAAHELWLGGRQFWTWCAYDVVGIVAALGADARSISRSPATGATIQLHFSTGHPPTTPVAVFFPDDRGSMRTTNDWCVNANFFENRATAQSWSTQRNVPGEVIDLEEARRRGLEHWQPLLISSHDRISRTDR